MSKPKTRISAMEIWQMRKPKFDGFACGHGAHANRKRYNRRAAKEQLRKEIDDENR